MGGSLLEILFLPMLNAITNGEVASGNSFAALRVIRLAKVIRIARIFGASSDAGPFFKGLLSGMKTAAFIWGLLLAMLYVFGVLLRLNASQPIKEVYFYNVLGAMVTLITQGVMLDEISGIVLDMINNRDGGSFALFSAFVFFAHFNLLSMLVGAFC